MWLKGVEVAENEKNRYDRKEFYDHIKDFRLISMSKQQILKDSNQERDIIWEGFLKKKYFRRGLK